MAFSPLSGSMIDPLTRAKRQIYATTPIEHEQLKKGKGRKIFVTQPVTRRKAMLDKRVIICRGGASFLLLIVLNSYPVG